jgi:hypothetical protein
METRNKHRTPTRMGTVFMGTGTGTKKYTHGLPVSHPSLEGGGRISESEKHHQRFEESTIRTKCCLPLITFFHLNIVVTLSYVKLCKVFRAAKLVDEFRDEWEGVPVFDCEGIQRSVVLYKVESAILLLDKEYWRCHG